MSSKPEDIQIIYICSAERNLRLFYKVQSQQTLNSIMFCFRNKWASSRQELFTFIFLWESRSLSSTEYELIRLWDILETKWILLRPTSLSLITGKFFNYNIFHYVSDDGLLFLQKINILSNLNVRCFWEEHHGALNCII